MSTLAAFRAQSSNQVVLSDLITKPCNKYTYNVLVPHFVKKKWRVGTKAKKLNVAPNASRYHAIRFIGAITPSSPREAYDCDPNKKE